MEPTISLVRDLPLWSDRDAFPAKVFILRSPHGEACYHVGEWEVTGIAVFSSEASAYRFGEWLPEEAALEAKEVDLAEAVEYVRARRDRLNCVLLLDSVRDPKVFPVAA